MKQLMLIIGFLSSLLQLSGNTFTGSYSADGIFGPVILDLEQYEDGSVNGSLEGNSLTFELIGTAEGDHLKGEVVGQAIVFTGMIFEGNIQLSLTELNLFGLPAPETTQVLEFTQFGEPESTEESVQPPAEGAVVINQVTLSEAQKNELTELYGAPPLPGNYWYDSMSGLYGANGFPAYGFMQAGHRFGTLKRKASEGKTKVIVNNRELPQDEWAVWSYLLGYWIEPGNYWLDAYGNAGYVGVATPVVNLYQAAVQNSYSGQGGSGDNFWSTRFSAGNSNADNTQGYVSVPGHGPIGYGF